MSRIEETASGAVACQVIDCLFPGSVPMHKLNWGARGDYEFIQNYKVLQDVFRKLDVDKKIEVNRLIRARYQDNLEFMQWLRKFFEINSPAVDNPMEHYDAVARRNKGKNVKLFKAANTSKTTVFKKKTSSSRPLSISSTNSLKKKQSREKLKSPEMIKQPDSSIGSPKPKIQTNSVAIKKLEDENMALKSQVTEYETKNKDLVAKNEELEEDLVGLEREREFYFLKLSEVEKMIQNLSLDKDTEEYKLAKQILVVLYKSNENENEAEQQAEEAAIKSLNVSLTQDEVSATILDMTDKVDEKEKEMIQFEA